jgi:hypothetical protein
MYGIGISRFAIDQSGPIVQLGAGLRASISGRWGVDVSAEDLIQLGADYTDLDAASTPPANANQNVLFSTVFAGKEGAIHSYALRFAVNYAFWPYGAPR